MMQSIADLPPTGPGEMSPTAAARLSGHECMGNAAGVAHELALQLAEATPGSRVLLLMDPRSVRRAPDRRLREAAVRLPELTRAAAGKLRPLDRFAAAVANWR